MECQARQSDPELGSTTQLSSCGNIWTNASQKLPSHRFSFLPLLQRLSLLLFFFKFTLPLILETESHSIALCCPTTHYAHQVDLDFTEISLSLSPECWDKRYASTHVAVITSFETRNILISLSSPGTLSDAILMNELETQLSAWPPTSEIPFSYFVNHEQLLMGGTHVSFPAELPPPSFLLNCLCIPDTGTSFLPSAALECQTPGSCFPNQNHQKPCAHLRTVDTS